MTTSRPSTPRRGRYITAYCFHAADHSREVVELSTPQPIFDSPPSKPIRQRLAGRFEKAPEDLFCLRLARAQGEPYAVVMSAAMPENEDALAMVRALRDEMKALRGEMVAMGQDHEDKMRAMDEEHRDEMTSLGEGHKALEADLRGEIQRLDTERIRGMKTMIPVLLYAVGIHLVGVLDPGGSAYDNFATLTEDSAGFRACKAERPVVGELLTTRAVRRLCEAIDIEERNMIAHPNLAMPTLVSSLFALEKLDWDEHRFEGVLALALRVLLATSPLLKVHAWMTKIAAAPDRYPQPTSEQLHRFSKVL